MRSFNSMTQCLCNIVIVFVTTCLDRCGVFMRALVPQRTCMFKRHTMMRAAARICRVCGAILAVALVTVSCQVTVSTPTPSDTTIPTFTDGPRVDASTDTGATVVLKASEDATLYWVLYRENDTTPDSAATLIGHATASGGTQRDVVDITTDTREIDITGLDPDTTYNFYAVLKDKAENIGALARVTLTTVPQGQPDLTVVVTANSSSAVAGGSVPLSATVTNSGAAAAVPTTLQWYRSADATIGSTDTPVGSAVAVTALAAGAAGGPLNTTATASTTAGTVYYGACVVALPNEANSTNNCSSGVKITVTEAPKADLTVAVTATAPSVVAGGRAVIHATVTNRGNAAAAPTTLQWYSSADAAIDVGDTPLGSPADVVALNVGAATQLTATLTAPTTPGTIYYGACVTAISGEADAANNCSSVAINVTEAPKADLTVVVTANHTAPTVGQDVTLSATVTNSGGADAAITTLQWYSSSDAAIDTSDTALGSQVSVAALTAGTSASALTTTATAPSTPGTLYYGACVTAVAGEADATNNCHSVEITVTAAPKPDLTVAPPTALSLTVQRGATFTLTTTVTNGGAGAADATDLQWYSSLDTTIGADDTTLGSAVDVVALAAGAATAALSSGDIGAPAAPGVYHYGACVAAVTDEANTNNNCSASVTITVSAIYTCSNGNAKTGNPAGNTDVGACQSCSGGFKLSGTPGDVDTTCVDTVYTCNNGNPTTGSKPAGTADIGACQSCSDSFKLSGAPGVGTTCVDTDYTCSNGAAKDGKPTGTADVEGCSSCESEYKLGGTGGDDCVPTIYTCNNGAPTDGSPAGNSDVAQCQRCDTTYKLLNNACTTRTVYTCSNGAAKTGNPAGNDDVEGCSSCDSGYKFGGTGGDDCVATVYTCSNGTEKSGRTNTNADQVACQSCNGGFKLMGSAGANGTTCVDTVYTCTNGAAQTGKPTGTADVEECATCLEGYLLNATTKACDPNPDFILHTNGVTVLCVGADVDASGDVDINGTPVTFTKRVVGSITTANAATTCTSGIGDMSNLFLNQATFNGDISHWDTRDATTMASMFNGARAFNRDIGSWNVSNVSNMSRMFRFASAFNQNIGSWNVSNVTDMSSMFQQASAFNRDIGSWNVSNVSNMSSMFKGAHAFNQDIGGWDVSKVTNMENMFESALAFNQDIGSWGVSTVTNMESMFRGAQAFNGDIGSWGVSTVTNMKAMFLNASAFNGDIGDWGVSNVKDMSSMFNGAIVFNRDLSWDVSNVTDMESMFRGAQAFNGDIGSWGVSTVTNMNAMFLNASAFNQNLSGWCVSQISSAPLSFATGAAKFTAAKPVWGTCPNP